MTYRRITSFTVRLTPAERPLLLARQRALTPRRRGPTGPDYFASRRSDAHFEVAATVGISRHHVYKWIQRFAQQGLDGLHNKPGRRRPFKPLPQALGKPHTNGCR